jgi:dolichol-phosphate mannosyltransferase
MVSVIVPSRNEADNLPRLIGAIHDALAAVDHEIVCVDDSDDETPDVLAALAQDDPRLRVDHRRVRNGLAGAVIDGVRQARGDMVAVIDADLQHPPQCLASLLAAVEAGADVAVASRFVPGGDDGGLPPTRKLVSFVARFVVRACLSRTRSVRDVTSGFFLLRRSVIEGVALTPTGWKILLEVLQLGRYSAVVEVPMHFGRRRAGRSKLSPQPGRPPACAIRGGRPRGRRRQHGRVRRP